MRSHQPPRWRGLVAAGGLLLLTTGCATTSDTGSTSTDVDPADGNWYGLAVDFTTAWGDIVRWDGGPDLTGTSWTVSCSKGGSFAVIATGDSAVSNEPYVGVRVGYDGTIEQLQIKSDATEFENYLWYLEGEAVGNASEADPGQVVFEGTRAIVSGQAFEYLDYNYETPINFEVRLTCDSWN